MPNSVPVFSHEELARIRSALQRESSPSDATLLEKLNAYFAPSEPVELEALLAPYAEEIDHVPGSSYVVLQFPRTNDGAAVALTLSLYPQDRTYRIGYRRSQIIDPYERAQRLILSLESAGFRRL